MPKTFYTERDIVDLVKQGVRSLIVDEDVVLTDLAYEKAGVLGMVLLRQADQPPGAPVRPYIAKLASPSAQAPSAAQSTSPAKPLSPTPAANPTPVDELQQRVYKAVVARLGDSVDPTLLEVIVQRVLKSVNAN